ncbi:MAG: efflux RND transporter permease subunit [Nitrospirae bacterium]|nr:efflux RND transporter permease subunit [Nitrospirota bacterium]
MWSKIISFSLKNGLLVIAVAALTLFVGYGIVKKMPIDVYPELTDPRVTILTEAPGWSPEEVETLVTFPMESAFNGMPYVKRVRSSSGIGLSLVIIEFEWGTEIFRARQMVTERLQTVTGELPSGVEAPFMAPISSRLGEIVEFAVVDQKKQLSPMEMRDLADWVIRFRLQSAGGIANVMNMGGYVKEDHVLVHPNHLVHYGVTLREVLEAIERSNVNAAGGFLEDVHQEYLVRGLGRIRALEDVRNVVIKTRENGVPVYVKNVADVKIEGPIIRRGAGGLNGEEVVLGRVIKQPGTNTLELTGKIQKIFEELKTSLPEGVVIQTEYLQSEVIGRAVETVRRALYEGGFLVIGIIALFLYNIRSSLIVLTTIPISLILTVMILYWNGMTLNIMTLAGLALAIGLVVDGSIVTVENTFRRLQTYFAQNVHPEPVEGRHFAGSPEEVVQKSLEEVIRPIAFAILIIILVFLPIFALSGLEGRLFSPLALAVVIAMGVSLLVAVTLIPVLIRLLLAGGKGLREKESPLLSVIKRAYRPLLDLALRRRGWVVILSLLLIAVAGALIPFMGKEFLPVMDEGTLVLNVRMLPGTSMQESLRIGRAVEKSLLEIPEVTSVSNRTGRAEQDEHAEGVNVNEILVNVLPPEKRKISRAELLGKVREKVEQFPGAVTFVGQPIQHRIDEMLSGVTAQVAIKLFGSDLETLREKAGEIERAVSGVPGAADVLVEQQVDVPQLQITVKREEAARYGLSVGDISHFIETAFKGEAATEVILGQRKYDLVVVLDEEARGGVEAMKTLLIDTPAGPRVPLERVADIRFGKGPNTINRENVSRRIVIQTNVAGRDLGGYIEEVQRTIAGEVKLPEGYYVVYGGQFEAQQEAMRQILVLLIGVVLMIFLLLTLSLGSIRIASLVMLNLPLAAVGGVIGVFFSGGTLSIPSLVGFILLFGIAVSNGIILLSFINDLRTREGLPLKEAIVNGALLRVRPVLMTALANGLGMLPLALATGSGAEIQKPLAIVIVGGIATSTVLTLLALPVFYYLVENRRERDHTPPLDNHP